jgi:hypothetical protein
LLVFLVAASTALICQKSHAQDSEVQMENLLDKVESSRGMQQGIQAQERRLMQGQMQQQAAQQPALAYPGGNQNNYRGSNGFSYPPQQRGSIFSQSPLRPQQQPRGPFGGVFGGQQAAAPPVRAPMTKRDLLRMFLEGGDGGSSTSSSDSKQAAYQKQQNNQRKYNSAASYRQTAENAAMRALGAEERTRYGNKSSRMSAADEAYYAAQAARGAANSATAAASGGALNANDAAASARNAADRAQASADRARSNANSYHDSNN